MIEAEVKHKENFGREITYPYLGEYKTKKDYVVFFFGSSEGVVVSTTPDVQHKVGFHSVSWVESMFKPFEGSITLTQE